MQTMTATLRIVTPLFLGGADVRRTGSVWRKRDGTPGGPIVEIPTELRPPSLKGAIRFWFRAIHDVDGRTRELEDKIMGSVRTGHAACTLRIVQAAVLPEVWDPSSPQIVRYTHSVGKYRQNGITYLGFSHRTRLREGAEQVERAREYLAPNGTFQLVLRGEDDALKVYWAGVWLLCALGGLGSRSRRGFGSLCIDRVQSPPVELPRLEDAQDLDDLVGRMQKGFAMVFGLPIVQRPGTSARYTCLHPGSQVSILDNSFSSWHEALASVGSAFQGFRFKGAGYADVKAFVNPSPGTPRALKFIPDRVDFGLPLNFFFSSIGAGLDRDDGPFRGVEHARRASPLLIHVGRFGSGPAPQFYVVLAHLPAPTLPAGEEYRAKAGGAVARLPHVQSGIVTNFLSTVSSKRVI